METRFEFGKNWSEFLENLDDERISTAVGSLAEWLGTPSLEGKTFLDIGSGSGLFSLSARKMGAHVYSFDYDDNSVVCTSALRDRYFPGDSSWSVEWGNALDRAYLSKYDKCDIVYSWGVLHHTGDMYAGLENAGNLVKAGGTLFVAIYNDQGYLSCIWKRLKRMYNLLPSLLQNCVCFFYLLRLWVPKMIWDTIHLTPFRRWKEYKKRRGMSPWHDVVDWVGGYPFEVAKPEEIFEFFHRRGFTLEKMETCGGGSGCNQFVFKKNC